MGPGRGRGREVAAFALTASVLLGLVSAVEAAPRYAQDAPVASRSDDAFAAMDRKRAATEAGMDKAWADRNAEMDREWDARNAEMDRAWAERTGGPAAIDVDRHHAEAVARIEANHRAAVSDIERHHREAVDRMEGRTPSGVSPSMPPASAPLVASPADVSGNGWSRVHVDVHATTEGLRTRVEEKRAQVTDLRADGEAVTHTHYEMHSETHGFVRGRLADVAGGHVVVVGPYEFPTGISGRFAPGS